MDFVPIIGAASALIVVVGISIGLAIAVRIAIPDETRDDLDDPHFYTTEESDE